MSGIYIHVPFCKKACHYCNFHFSTTLSLRDEMIRCLVKEIEIVSAGLTQTLKPVETIYFGGGTPSLLFLKELNEIINALQLNFSCSPDAEITFEVNPDDVTTIKLKEWKSAGINRLSLGIQSFYDTDLEWMNRAHNAAQAVESIKLITDCGYSNFSADLIYGMPNLSDEQWKQNVQKVINLQIPHLSCYALTVEPATALWKMIEKKISNDISNEQQANQFLMLMEWLREAGYEHYEISNFALPGFRSRHNSNYWKGINYIGIGPSAHSYFGTTRRWNVSNNALYIQSLKNNIVPFESEELTDAIQLNEYIMTSLRTIEGLNTEFVGEKFGENKAVDILYRSEKYVADRRMRRSANSLVLTNRGKLYADGIASDLFS